MKANILIAVTTLAMGSSLAMAAGQSQENEAHHPESAPASAPGMPAMAGGCMPMMQEHMQKMRAQMEEIHGTSDPDKRNELIQAHMDSMREMMNKMRDMHRGKAMMGGPNGYTESYPGFHDYLALFGRTIGKTLIFGIQNPEFYLRFS